MPFTSPIAQTPPAARSRSSTSIPLFRDGEIEVLEAETLHVRPPAGGNEQPLGLDRPAAFEMEAEAWLDSIERRAEAQLDSLALELLAQKGAGFRVLSGQQPLGDVDERHV